MWHIRRTGILGFALLAALALGVGGLARAQRAGTQSKTDQQSDTTRAPYRSSIQVANDEADEAEENEAGENENEQNENEQNEAQENAQDEGEGGAAEAGEAARFQSLARVTADQARAAAVAQVPGTVRTVELDNEDGNLVYSVEIATTAGERDVKVDAGNARVLHVEKDDQER